MMSTSDNTAYVNSSLDVLINVVAHVRCVSIVNQLTVVLKEFAEDGLAKLLDNGFDIPTREQIQEMEQKRDSLIGTALSVIEITSFCQGSLSITLDMSKVMAVLSVAEAERPKASLEELQGLQGEVQLSTASIDTQQ